jgi:tripartite-type tricarboxylate transporter receptor subunit TctC
LVTPIPIARTALRWEPARTTPAAGGEISVSITRRLFLFALALLPAAPVAAQTYPDRTITIICPFAPGGPTDALSRQVAAFFEKKLGQHVIVENVSGGASTIGTMRVARAAADGYTLLLHNLAISANPTLHPKVPLDPAKDLTVVGFINHNPLVLAGRKTLQANTIPELVTWLKANTGRFATPGAGTTGHLASVLFVQSIGAKMDHIPYRGGAPALQDVIAGHVDFFFGTPQALIEPYRAHLIKLYGATDPEPGKQLPDVPSFVKAYGPKLEISFWHGLFAPAGTPRAVIDKLNAALQDLQGDAETVKNWAETGVDVYPKDERTPEAGQKMLASEITRWRDVIRDNHIEARQ